MKGITIRNKRLTLREYTATDWKAVHEYARLGEILIYESWGPNSEEDSKNFIGEMLDAQFTIPRVIFGLAIFLESENRLIGGCEFRLDPENNNQGSLGYIVNPAYWLNGYASEAAANFAEYVHKTLGIKTIGATCDTLNISSKRVLEKCGFRQVTLIENHVKIKGRNRHTYFYEKEF